MANQPIKQIIRYHDEGMAIKRIVNLTRTARNTFKQYLFRYNKLGLAPAEIESLDQFNLHQLFSDAPPKELIKKDPRYERLEPLLLDIVNA
jgi:hypothetical protein